MIRWGGTLSIVMMLGACDVSEPPFIYASSAVTIGKDKDDLHLRGTVSVCYHDPDLDVARALAVETCQEYGLKAYQIGVVSHYQCKISTPHMVNFRCYDPQMRFASGGWVNPLNKVSVSKWRKEQMGLGKSLDDIYAGPIQAIPADDGPLIRNDADEPMQIGR